MKKLFLILMLFPLHLFGQQDSIHFSFRDHLQLKNELINYSEVVQVDGLTKDEIYVQMNEWFVRNFNSPKHVIQMQDKEAGKIMAKTQFVYKSGKGIFAVPYIIDYILSFEARDGRYRLEASQFTETVTVMNVSNTYPLEVMFQNRKMDNKVIPKIVEMADYITNEILSTFESAKRTISLKQDSAEENW